MKNRRFNEEVKERFLKNYQKDTADVYTRIFNRAYNLEKIYKKDLYDFNLKEIEELLFDLNPTTETAARFNGSIVINYVDWAIQEGLRYNNINPIKLFEGDYFERFVDETIKLYITESQLVNIEEFCTNAQDALIFRLLFEGFNGKKLNELTDLTIDNVDENNNMVYIKNRNKEIPVSTRCVELIKEAYNEDRYEKNNGYTEDFPSNLLPHVQLARNKYILRNCITRLKDYNKPVDSFTIYRRNDLIKDMWGAHYLNPKSLMYSGMLYMAYQIITKNEDKYIYKKDYEEICDQFNYKYRTIYNLKNIVNEENINKIYCQIL